MKNTLVFLLSILSFFIINAQSNNCDGAEFLTGAQLNCQVSGESISGNTDGAGTLNGLNIPGCIDATNKEGQWFKFIAEGSDIEILNNGGVAPHVIIFNNVCPPNLSDVIYCGQANINIETNEGDNLLITGNTYIMWIGFAIAAGPYDLCITNPKPPLNDLCEHAEIITPENLNCPEIYDPVIGHTTNASQQGLYFTDIDPLVDLACALDTTKDSGVWYQFTAIGTDLEIVDNLENNPTILLMRNTSCSGDTISEIFCQQTPISSDFGEVGNNATVIGDEYLMYVTFQGGEAQSDTFELCIDNDGGCNSAPAPNSWCQTIPICGLEALDGYCLSMVADNRPSEAFPGCPNSLDNPNWFSFIAEATNMTIQIQIGDCLQGQGVQLGMYQIRATENLGPNRAFCSVTDPGLGPLLTGCATIAEPQGPGTVVTFNATTAVGSIYAIVVDGWGPDLCQLEVNVLQGGDPINLDGLVLDPPIWDDSIFPFNGDTVCVRARSVLFRLSEELAVCGSNWTLDGQILEGENRYTRLVDFPIAGTYTICVSIENSISSSDTVCIDVVASEFFPTLMEVDTFFSCDELLFINARNYPGFENIEGITFYLPDSTFVETDALNLTDAGTYIITGQECSQTLILNVNQPVDLNVNITPDDCYFSTIELIVQGTINPSYSWSTGDTSSTVDSLTFGWHTVTISSDNNVCDYIRSYFIDFPDSCKRTITGIVNLQDTTICGTNAQLNPIENQKVEITPIGIIAPTNAAGQYAVDLPPGIYQVRPILDPTQIQSCPIFFIDTITASTDTVVNDFNILDTNKCALEICISSGISRPGRLVTFSVSIKNNTPHNSIVELNAALDEAYSLSTINSSAVPIASTLNGIVRWSDVTIPSGSSRTIIFTIRLKSTTQTGNILSNLFYLDECAEDKILNQVVQASYDPNDKTLVNTLGRPSNEILKSDSILDYVIRFQNTGNDTAFFVQVTDQLSEHFDLHSFSPGAASHDYTWRILPDRMLEFTFDPILLPYQSIDDDGSQGFVSFSIRPNEDFILEDSILNNAAIFFDFNAPVITNTVNTKYKRPQYTQTIYTAICEGDTFLGVPINTDTLFEIVIDYFDFDSVYTYSLEAIDTETFSIDTNVVTGSVFLGDTIKMDTMFILSYIDTENGCEYFIEYNVHIISGISNTDAYSVTVSPNPFNTDLQFFAQELIQKIGLYDVNGKLILVQENTNSNNVSLSTHAIDAGLYLAIVTMSDKQHHVKVMKL